MTGVQTCALPISGQDNAAKKCKAERASMGEKAFAERYGTNPNKRNAFGKCVAKYSKDKPKPAKP